MSIQTYMHRIIQYLILSAVACVLPLTLAAQTVHLTLKEAFAMAKDANFDLLIATENVESSRQAVVRSRSGLLPSVTAEAGQSRGRSINNNNSNNNIAESRISNRFDTLLRARLSLLDFNNIANFKVAQYNLQIAQAQLDDTVEQILQGIAVAYFTYQRDLSQLAVIDANLARDRVLVDIARNQYEGGVATPLDVTRAEVQLATNELARLQQETQVMDSALYLKQILNIPLDAELQLSPVPIPEQAPSIENLSTRIDQVLSNRPDYQLSIESLERNRYARRAAGWERLPSVEVSGTYGYGAEKWDDDLEKQWSVGVGVSVPVFEGFRIQANKREADSAVRSQEYVIRRLEQEIAADYRLALQDLRSRYQQVQVSRKTVELNRREYELARTRFEEGVADNADVVTAQARLAEAEGVLVNAEFAFHNSQVQLARVSGDVRQIVE